MIAAPTVAQIRAQVAAVLEQPLRARAIAIRAPGNGTPETTLQVGGRELRVLSCSSVLALRERLISIDDDAAPLVVLTPLDERELGADLLARLAKRRVFAIDPWQLVKDRFRARYVDPRLVEHYPWVARVLLEVEPQRGYAPAPSGFLQSDFVWRALFEPLLGLPGGACDAEALIEWSATPTVHPASGALDAELRGKLAAAVGDEQGPVARRIFECGTGPRPESTLAVGLCARVLLAAAGAGDEAALKGIGKLDALLGGGALDNELLDRWAKAAERVIERRLAATPVVDCTALLERADALLAELGVRHRAHHSRFLRAGYEQRVGCFAERLERFAKGKARRLPAALIDAAEATLDHALAASDRYGSDRVDMALRLARWLAVQRSMTQGEVPPASFAQAAAGYRSEGGFVDWARLRVRGGDGSGLLAEAATTLWKAALTVREAQSARFAELLAKWCVVETHDQQALAVEDLLDARVAPLAAQHPVLLVVMDGMGMAVYRELQPDLARRGWVELDALAEAGRDWQIPVIAALPSVTGVSRMSLLAGRLASGESGAEKQAFAAHAGLARASEPKRPPVLFHKGDLSGSERLGVAPPVLDAIADLHQRVVGVVINAVDDYLAKGDQLRIDWTVHGIRPLEEVLAAARDVGRALVLVSDHGHVSECDTESAGEAAGERWREAGEAAGNGEIEVEGPRVLLGENRRVVLPWSERIRYGIKKNGYHGGAAPQEVVIPLGLYAPVGVELAGYREAAPEIPMWWEAEFQGAVAHPAASAVAAPAPRPPEQPGEQGRLFGDAGEVAAAHPSGEPEWIVRLLASDVYAAQRRRASRVALADQRVRAILVALDARGGKLTRKALAKEVGVPPLRLGGVLSALRRVLNVEGYAVLMVDESADTVEVNRKLLATQFGIR